MQCATDLVKLRDAISSRIRHLSQITSSLSTPLSWEDRRALSFATVELDNLIVVGLRQYAKSSLLRARTSSGSRITATVKPATGEEAAALILKSLNPKAYQKAKNPVSIAEKDELVFRDPKKVETVLTTYQASNQSNLALALSLNSSAFSEIKVFRHYFSHRMRNTYEAVQNFAVNNAMPANEIPERLLLRGRPGSGVRLLDGWLADINTFFDLAS
jgi:hypothetical protein